METLFYPHQIRIVTFKLKASKSVGTWPVLVFETLLKEGKTELLSGIILVTDWLLGFVKMF